jgi:hypothetical protein
MRWRAPLGAALLVLLTIPTTGFGWFHSLFSRSSYRAAPATVYYCPVPVAVAPAPYAIAPAVAAVPPPAPPPAAPAPPPGRYAEPRPAPPSGTAEPPRAPAPMPPAGVNAQESRKLDEKFYDSYFAATPALRAAAADRCAVTFWNLSGHTLTLTVDGTPRTLATGQNVRLDLKRDFAWAVSGRDSERQQVPAAESGVEIVIRR